VAKRGPRIRTAAESRAFWAADDARVKAITMRIEVNYSVPPIINLLKMF
jgi:hypothetical protein